MNSYDLAREQFSALGIDTEAAITVLDDTPISLHCWQGDDVGGFEHAGASLSGGGIQATGNYPGKARTIDELRADLEMALSLIPGRHRLNLHASYADLSSGRVERDEYTITQFQSWVDWCRARGMGMDFNPTYFSHPLAESGLTLSHPDPAIRKFWIRHGIACRQIGAEIGRQLGTPTVTNFWIPDGSKDIPFDRKSPRLRLAESLDEIFCAQADRTWNLDAVESKLFGIGSESYVVGSHEFYLSYAVKNGLLYCLDAGHFHPTENLGDKISSILQFVPRLLLHVSRGVRWDSDHVVLFDDPTRGIMEELVRGDYLGRTHIGLDFFDASINRVAAWVIGTRSALKCLLAALLEPARQLREGEESGDFTARLAWMEEAKSLPFGAVWEEFCQRHNMPGDHRWIDQVKAYERTVLAGR
ncbi:MAG: L-rhamnose isomerase [Terrimicrobiaceae bacterium]